MQDLHQAWGEAVAAEMAARTPPMSNRHLARLCGVHPTTIARVLSGDICATDELKWKIAGALGQRMDRLWQWPQVIPPAPREVA